MHTEANTSSRILEAALQLFSEKGYDATSTREICEAAGITKPSLYYFFDSKEGVYRALVDAAFLEYAGIVESGLATPGTLRDKLKKIAELIFASTCAQTQLVRLIFSIVYSGNAPLVRQTHTSYEKVVAHVRDAVAKAAAEGEIAPGDVTVRMLVLNGAMAEAVSNYLICGKPQLTRKLAHAIIDDIFAGWRAGVRTR